MPEIEGDGHLSLWLVRHGETLFNRSRLTQGWCDSPLTAEGRSGVATLASELQGIPWTAVVSSTSERATDTAEIIVGDAARIERDRRWREYNFGIWEGRPEDDTLEAFLALSPVEGQYAALAGLFAGDYPALEGGETGAVYRSRVTEAIADIRGSHHGDVLVVSHGMTIAVAALVADPVYPLHRSMGNATFARLDFTPDGAATVRAFGASSLSEITQD